MKAQHHRRLAVLTGLCLAAPAVFAETLEEAWSLALQNDRSLAAVRSEAEAAALEADAARAQRWPTLAVGGRYTWLDESPAFDFSWTGLPISPPPIFADDRWLVEAFQQQTKVMIKGWR